MNIHFSLNFKVMFLLKITFTDTVHLSSLLNIFPFNVRYVLASVKCRNF